MKWSILLLLSAPALCLKELIFLQSMWRHGDRSPTETFKSDVYQEDAWTFGGGGWGQLSPKGMQQHLGLGKLIRERYVTNSSFLSPHYNAKEIYVRSTDVNRTLISAFSNLLGMYGLPEYKNEANKDYPDVAGWPVGYVPIPIHTVDNPTDHIGNVDSGCKYQTEIWNLAKQAPEITEYMSRPEIVALMNNLTQFSGQEITIDNFWIVADALLIERLYNLHNNTWCTDELFANITNLNDKIQLWNNGIFDNQTIVNGLDVGLLLRKLRGGPALNDVVNHINLKIRCLNESTGGCHWIHNLKYHAYSFHDTTIYALFSALLMEDKVITPKGQYPQYSACVLFELFKEDDQFYFKIHYHHNENEAFQDVTNELAGCEKTEYCPLSVIQQFADDTRPDQPINEWCESTLTSSSSTMSLIGVLTMLVTYLLF